MDGVVPDFVLINQYQTLQTNVEQLKASDCTIAEVYELLQNMHFLNVLCSIQA